MKRPAQKLAVSSGFPVIAIISAAFGFFAFLVLLFVQLYVTVPVEPGEISAWGGEGFTTMIVVCFLFIALLVLDAIARGKILSRENRLRLIMNSMAACLMAALAFNLNQWLGL